MIKQIRKEIEEFNDHENHMDYISSMKYDFVDLVNLTTRTNANFKIRGNYRNFTIHTKPLHLLFIICFTIFLMIPALAIGKSFTNPIFWLVESMVLMLILLFVRYFPSTNDITIDSINKNITITSNNFIGKYIIPKLKISFADFVEFTFKAKSSGGKGMTNHFNQIYINYTHSIKPLIGLPNGPIYFVNHKIFIECLTQIIKNGA